MRMSFKQSTFIVALLMLVALLLLSLRGVLDPYAASLAFGLPATDDSARFYHAVYRDRNLVLAITGLTFLLTRMWRALAVLCTVAVTLPAYDIVMLMLNDVVVAPLHFITLVGLSILSVMLWGVDRHSVLERNHIR